jgi:CRP-like cAMP-binding protein
VSETLPDPKTLLKRLLPPMPSGAIETLAARATAILLSKGETAHPVCYPGGQQSDGAIFIVRGVLEARFERAGRSCTVETYGPADVVGLWAHASDHDVSYRVAEPVEAVILPLTYLHAAMRQDGYFAALICARLAQRHAEAMRRAADLMLSDVADRVWTELQRSAVQRNPGTADRIVRMSQQELAERVGACRETVSRVVAAFVRRGRLQRLGSKRYVLPASPAAVASS